MVNQQILEGNWNTIKGQLQKKWGKLTDDELQSARGDANQLVGVIQRKTGEAREQIETEIETLIAEGASAISHATDALRNAAGQVNEHLAGGYEHVAATGREALRHVTDGVEHAYDRSQQLVKDKPVMTLGTSFCLGVVAGVLATLMCSRR